MSYDAYLQGSYPNATNIRGNSDVDLVVETDSVFYSNLREDEKSLLSLSAGGFTWDAFRSEVLKALVAHYGVQLVDDSGDKCIGVLASGNRLSADVVPCVEYRRYDNLRLMASGMTFWTKKSKLQVINYPKIHIDNGVSKNDRVSRWYKPAIRMFKNAHERFDLQGIDLGKKFPSYFIECLFYNAADECYGSSFSDTFLAVANDLWKKCDSNSISNCVAQNEQHRLFGTALYQWNETDARTFVNELVRLWNEW